MWGVGATPLEGGAGGVVRRVSGELAEGRVPIRAGIVRLSRVEHVRHSRKLSYTVQRRDHFPFPRAVVF